jgi:iron(III) transport system permease protein
LLSFGLPFCQLLYWSALSYTKVLNAEFFRLVFNSFTLAAGAGLLTVVLATVLLYAQRLSPFRWLRQVASVATLGYAIPGAIIAVGVMIPLLRLDQWVMAQLSMPPRLLLSGTLFALVFAYVVRFLAVGYNPVEAGFQKIGRQVHEASRMLGAGSWRTLWAVELPLLRASLLSGVLLVFVDLLKELPLTLILRPFNFHTLATKAFDLATNEMIAESSSAALVIVLTGILPILLLNQIIRRTR